MPDQRCDLCGPYTPEEAADLVMGRWRPEMSGYLCPDCKASVHDMAQQLADEIDSRAMAEAMRIYGNG